MRDTIIVVVLLFQYGCDNHGNDQGDGFDILNAKIDTVNIIEPRVDTLETIDTIQQDTIAETPKVKQHPVSSDETIEVETEAEDVPVDPYLNDPMKDPDYIGTPCKLDGAGKCFRHDHGSENPQPEPPL